MLHFEGWASVFNVKDDAHDVIPYGAFAQTLDAWRAKQTLPPMLWQHNMAEPIGRWHTIEEQSYGLYVKGELVDALARGKEAAICLEQGLVRGLSIGFQASQSHTIKGCRYLEHIRLFEISLVTIPANTFALLIPP